MSKGFCQGGLVMFKKSFAEAVSKKDQRESCVKEKKMEQSGMGDNGLSRVNSGKTKFQSVYESQTRHKVIGRGRGCPQKSHDASNVSSAPGSGRTPLSCWGSKNLLAPEEKTAQSVYPEFVEDKSKTDLDAGQNQVRKQPMTDDLQERKRSENDRRPRLKYRRDQDFALKQSVDKEVRSFENQENLQPERAKVSNVICKSEDGCAIKESSSTRCDTDQLDTSTDRNSEEEISPLDKIHNMFKMYEERILDGDSKPDMTRPNYGNLKNKPSKIVYNDGHDVALEATKQSNTVKSTQGVSGDNSFKPTSSDGRLEERNFHLETKNRDICDDSNPPSCDIQVNHCVDLKKITNDVEVLSISSGCEIPTDYVVTPLKDITLECQESPREFTETRCVYEASNANEAFANESPLLDENIIDQENTSRTFSEFEVDVYSQCDSESSSEEDLDKFQAANDNYAGSYPYRSNARYHPGHQETYYNHYSAINKHNHHGSASHPRLYPHPPTHFVGYSYPHHQAYSARGNNSPLVIPSDEFGSRESMEMAVNYVQMQRKKMEEYAENCYGVSAPLDVVICVRESQTWARPSYAQHSHSDFMPVHHKQRPIWQAPHGQGPFWHRSYPHNSQGFYPGFFYPSMPAQNAGSSKGQGNSCCESEVEETVARDCCISPDDDTSFPEEPEERLTWENAKYSTAPDNIIDSGDERERGQSSDEGSGSCYSTANSEDIYSAPEKAQSLKFDGGVSETIEGKTDIKNRDTVNSMDAKDKEMTLRAAAFKKRRDETMRNGNSVSSFLTPDNLNNDWTCSPSLSSSIPSPAKRKHLMPAQYRKRKSMVMQETYESPEIRHKVYSELSSQEALCGIVTSDDKRDMSYASEQSQSLNPNNSSVYFTPQWPGYSPNPSKRRASVSPYSKTTNLNLNSHTPDRQRLKSRSFSSDVSSGFAGTSPVPIPISSGQTSVSTMGNGQGRSSSGSRDSLSWASPCNHSRPGYDYGDRWKVSLMNRSKGYVHTFIDSHCHIDFLYSRVNSSAVSFKEFMTKHSDSFPSNYEGCVSVFCNPRTFCSYKPDGNDILNVVAKDDGVWIAAGCHPKNAMEFKDEHARGLVRILRECPKVVALGEIGLDYSGRFYQYAEVQKQVFRRQLLMALNLNLPIVIHCRDADKDCLKILQEVVPRHHKIHAHCFTRDLETAHKWMSLFPNLYLGLTPLITYKTAQEAIETAAGIPLERLLLETDAPYFVPTGVHLCHSDSKYSHPGLALYTAETVARLKGVPVNDVLKACRENTHIMYGI